MMMEFLFFEMELVVVGSWVWCKVWLWVDDDYGWNFDCFDYMVLFMECDEEWKIYYVLIIYVKFSESKKKLLNWYLCRKLKF